MKLNNKLKSSKRRSYNKILNRSLNKINLNIQYSVFKKKLRGATKKVRRVNRA